MRIETHGQQFEVTAALRDYAQSKLSRLADHFEQPCDIRVVLAGVKAPGLLGVDYARRFTQVYPDLAREQDVFYAPDFFTGVIGVSRYMQRDGIHPNAEGARIIAERLAPVVAKALRA